jgi:alkylation response protein AidB-like acyl-CoA dehydrogenase
MEMNPETTRDHGIAPLSALPGDGVREILWRFADREDLKELVRSVRAVARGPVARLVAGGARRSPEWSEEKEKLLAAFDEAGITSLHLEPEEGGRVRGPKNLAMALTALELAWVDGGAACGSLALQLGLAPIQLRGTEDQKASYVRRAVPAGATSGSPWRGAFALTEPLPFAGVDAGMLSGTVRVERWEAGQEPMLRVEKRGRFISNMDFARFVVAAVESADERIQGSCLVVLEAEDEGVFERGKVTRKLVHQLTSTRDPFFDLVVPAGRIVGGYEVRDGVIVPRLNHGQILDAVFRRTRVPVALMTAAKLLSAVEPLIRYHRERFRGTGRSDPASPRHELGLQLKEDVLQRLVDVWAAGEAGASLGLAAARSLDVYESLEAAKDAAMAERGVHGVRAEARALREVEDRALEYVRAAGRPAAERDEARAAALETDPLVRFVAHDALLSVLVPAAKLWNTGHGATMMREAVSLMGGYGITEEAPGFLGLKWMDAQLEATYEGPEAVQRRMLAQAMTHPVFLAGMRGWVGEMRRIGGRSPGTGGCTLGTAMELWLWTLEHLLHARDDDGKPLYREHRQGVTFLMADALAWLLAARYQILDVLALEERAKESPAEAGDLPGAAQFLTDLCRVQAARSAGEAGRICTELVYGYNRHPSWAADCGRCHHADTLEALETVIAGIVAYTSDAEDVIEADGSHPDKAGPCVRFDRLRPFVRIRSKLDGCLTESHLAKDRAARALAGVALPEALDYPT